MASVSGSDWRNVMNLPGLSDENAEYILDLGIDTLNLYGANLSNMSGDAGSKTVTLTSKERGAVFLSARAIYYGFHKEIETMAVAGMSLGAADLMSNPQVLNTIRQAAKKLGTASEGIPFKVAEDTTGYE